MIHFDNKTQFFPQRLPEFLSTKMIQQFSDSWAYLIDKVLG